MTDAEVTQEVQLPRPRVRWGWLALMLVCLLALGAGARHKYWGQAFALEPEPPTVMEAMDMAQLDAALAHLRELEVAAAPYRATVQRIGQRYKLTAQDRVDFNSGAIARDAAPRTAPP